MQINLDDLDDTLRAEVGAESGYTAHEIPHGNGVVQIAYSDADKRAGLLYIGSGSNGVTSWTDASSVDDAINRWVTGDLIN